MHPSMSLQAALLHDSLVHLLPTMVPGLPTELSVSCEDMVLANPIVG